MIKVEAIEEFTLKDFGELKNMERAGKSEEGKVFKGDKFECTEEMVKYLTGNNDGKFVVVKVIEYEPAEETVEEVKEEVIEEPAEEVVEAEVIEEVEEIPVYSEPVEEEPTEPVEEITEEPLEEVEEPKEEETEEKPKNKKNKK